MVHRTHPPPPASPARRQKDHFIEENYQPIAQQHYSKKSTRIDYNIFVEEDTVSFKDYPFIFEDIKKIERLSNNFIAHNNSYITEQQYRNGRYSYSLLALLGVGICLHLITNVAIVTNLGILGALGVVALVKIRGYENEKEHEAGRANRDLEQASVDLAEHIRAVLNTEKKQLDLFYLLHVLPDLDMPGMKPLKKLFQSLNPIMFSTKNKPSSLNFNNVPLFKDSVHNILSQSECTYIRNNCARVNDSVVEYFTNNEFRHSYEFLHSSIYKKIFSIDKDWSSLELENIAKCISRLPGAEKKDIITYIHKNAKNPDLLLNNLYNKSNLEINCDNPIIEINSNKDLLDKNNVLHINKLKNSQFFNLCVAFSEEKQQIHNFKQVAHDILERIDTINNFYDRISLEDKQIFDQLNKSDLPSLMTDWDNFHKLKASDAHKEIVLECLVVINQKLESIIINLQEDTLKNTKVLKKLYAKK